MSESLVVIDCSVTMAFLLSDEQPISLKKLIHIFKTQPMIVPTIWNYEVANVLVMAERKKRINESDLIDIKMILEGLGIVKDMASDENTLRETLSLAREHQLTVYDAAYLELAMRKHAALATFDQTLQNAAKTAGVELLI